MNDEGLLVCWQCRWTSLVLLDVVDDLELFNIRIVVGHPLPEGSSSLLFAKVIDIDVNGKLVLLRQAYPLVRVELDLVVRQLIEDRITVVGFLGLS